MTGNPTRLGDAIFRDVHNPDWDVKHESPDPFRHPAPRPGYQPSMESPDDCALDDDAASTDTGVIPQPRGMGTRPQTPHYGDVGRSGE